MADRSSIASRLQHLFDLGSTGPEHVPEPVRVILKQ